MFIGFIGVYRCLLNYMGLMTFDSVYIFFRPKIQRMQDVLCEK